MPTALIVEDEPEANRLLAMLVRLRGYQAESAFTGGEALEKAGHRRPDIVFLDLMLPDINGFEVCEALKSRRETNPIPVVLVSARLASDNRLQGYRVGASAYVPKPYTPDQIFVALSSAESWRRAVESQADTGEIALDPADEAGACERIARLRGLLLARAPWDEATVALIVGALLALVRRAVDWGKARGNGRVATLEYRLLADRLEVEIRDDSGWFSLGTPPREQLGDLIARGRFDTVTDHSSGTELTLTKNFPR